MRPIQGSQPLSRYGDCQNNNLTLGITICDLLSQEGFTDLSRLHEPIRIGSGQCYLPDKELRYLRTVIVTAAVYWGFGRELLPIARDDPLP